MQAAWVGGLARPPCGTPLMKFITEPGRGAAGPAPEAGRVMKGITPRKNMIECRVALLGAGAPPQLT